MDSFHYNTKESEIVIYGAGTNGIVTYHLLLQNGFHVKALIDRRAHEIDHSINADILTFEEFLNANVSRDVIILISVKNVFEHNSIAEKFIDKGYYNLIYKPYNSLTEKGSDKEEYLSQIYEPIIKGNLTKVADIPATTKLNARIFKDFAIIKKDDFVTFRAPVTMVYTNDEKTKSFSWDDLNCMALYPHIELFRHFDGDVSCTAEAYLEFCKKGARKTGGNITASWEKNVVMNRFDTFIHMNNSYDIHPDFFIENAPFVKWNPKGYFNLTGGKHRISFLVAKGQKFVPVKCTLADYEIFCNQDYYHKINSKALNEGIQKNHAPLLHPFFYKVLPGNGEFYFRALKQITLLLSRILYSQYGGVDFGKLNILTCLNDSDFIGGNLKKMGSRVKKSKGSQEKDSGNIFFPLLHYKAVEPVTESDTDSIFDLVFTDGCQMGYIFHQKINFRYLITISKLSGEFLNDQCEFEKCMMKGIYNHELSFLNLYQRRQNREI